MLILLQGFLVDEACNGQEAVDMVRVKEYTVIFMDNQMPIMVCLAPLCFDLQRNFESALKICVTIRIHLCCMTCIETLSLP